MTLAAGARLGPYEILAPLGAGGMGEVWRARDTRLGREVAIKVLPAEVASDAERLRRFEQEAKAVSALNHPNIVTLHELGRGESGPYLVLEKVEGKTIRELLREGALPLRRLLVLGTQIAEGLAKAHAAGIVHRDLKPDNVMLSEDGFAKILDFGLARLSLPELDNGPLTEAATLSKLTASGVILGTPGYLSPEQAAGRSADFRADQFALGALLYEMASGERPFRGATTMESLAAVLRDEPAPLKTKAPSLPAPLGWIVERCLAKDPDDRYASTRDLARDLADLRKHLSDISATATTGAPASSPRRSRERLAWTIAGAALLLALAALGGRWLGGARASPPRVRVERLSQLPGVEGEPTISPDGKSVVYVRNGDLWRQRVGGSNPTNLTPDSPGRDFAPAFSPDGGRIAFNSVRGGGGIFVMGATGENLRRVTTRGFRPAWTPDGRELVFVGSSDDEGYQGTAARGLQAVEIASGRVRSLCESCAARAPAVSSQGHSVAFWGTEGSAQRDLWLVPLAGLGGRKAIRLTDDPAHDWGPRWAPDGRSLLFVSDRGGSPNLWRLPIDEQSGRLLGAPEPMVVPASFVSGMQLAADGNTFVYESKSGSTELARIAFDPVSGAIRGSVQSVLRFGNPILGFRSAGFSPDSQWVAVQGGASGNDILVLRVDGSMVRTLVEGPDRNRSPAWSPDGKTIAFGTDHAGKYDIWGIAPDGSDLRSLVVSEEPLLGPAWSPDGSRVLAFELVQGRVWRTVVHRVVDPPHDVEHLPELPDGGFLGGEAWSREGDSITGLGSKGSIWRWSLRDRTHRKIVETEASSGLDALAALPGGKLLLYEARGRYAPGIRLELLDPVTGSRRVLLDDEAYSAALSPDQKSLWFNRWSEEADLWLATFEGAPR